MSQILLIARKDLKSYFSSPIAYIVIAVFLFIIGWMFFNLLSVFVLEAQRYSQISQGQRPTISARVLLPVFGNMNVILLMVTPFITMRLLAEEKKDHTIELLLTAPIRPIKVVLGKFLAALGLTLVIISLTLVYPLILTIISKPDWGVILSCYLGLILATATNVSIGLFWSSTTENQIVAAVLSFGTILFFWLISWAAQSTGTFWGEVLSYLSITEHYSSFAQGAVDTTDIIYYFSFIGVGLFLTNISFDSSQWS